MVGHTGNMDATIIGVETVDLALARIIKVCDEYNVTLLITADHGNADEMLEKNKKGELQVRTAHFLNPVPFIIYDKKNSFTIKEGAYGLANVAPTVASMLGLTPPACWEKSMI
jgi:2,3-bisphosphoglycerate-independent phosphoglycerate mutase